MNRDQDTTRDDWDESQAEDGAGDPTPPLRRPRPYRRSWQEDTRRRHSDQNRQSPPSRSRFTPARGTTGYQRQQPQQPGRPASGGQGQRSLNPRRQPRESREPRDFQAEDEEYEQYRQYRRPSERSRVTRQFREDVPEQSRRYPRQPIYPRERVREPYERTTPRRAARPEYDDDDYAVDTPAPVSRTRTLPATTPTRPAKREARPRRRVWSTLLIGCAGGAVAVAIIGGIIAFVVLRVLPNSIPGFPIGTTAYTSKQQTISLPIIGNISQLSIQNQVGNITITTDNNAKTGTVTFIKKTMATSQSNANAEFARIAVAVNHGSTTGATNGINCPAATCLALTSTIPNTVNDAVDMAITLPPQNPSPTFILSSNMQSGNISVQNFNGLLSLAVNNTGNISVKGGLLNAGSCLQAHLGNVTFTGILETSKPPAINPCYGNPIAASGASNDQPWYSMKTGTGNLDVSFSTLSTDVQLDVTAPNQGKITSDFPLAIKKNSDGSSNYFGPLLPNTQPAAFLTLTVDVAGNITLRKA